VVCDGFVGNVALKTVEGLGRELAAWCRAELAGSLPAPRLTDLTTRLLEATNPIERQGSLPLLGVRGPVVMAHGAADRRAVRAAIAQAAHAARVRFVDTLAAALADTADRLRGQPNQARMTSGSFENQ
jgi:phosphate acyltransferase